MRRTSVGAFAVRGAVRSWTTRLRIDDEDFESARRLLAEVEGQLGADDPEATRARALMSFLESKV
jgi:hypothetical protein